MLADQSYIESEQKLREAIWTGALVELCTDKPEADDPAHLLAWVQQRTVRAEVLAELLTQHGDGSRRPRALRLAGARITGVLDLEGVELVCPLLLRGCWFDEPVNLSEAQAVAIRLPGCRLPALWANELVTRGNLELDMGFTAHGEVQLLGAHIGGALSFVAATLTNPDGPALIADGLTVGRGMYCREGFTAQGEVHMIGAHIGGQLNFVEATLTNPGGLALSADGLTVDQAMICSGFTAQGEVHMIGAHIGRLLDLVGATLTNPDGPALIADGLTVDQDMYCREGFTAQGEVHLNGAHIGGLLDLRAATLTNPDGSALSADGLTVGHMICSEGFTAQGEVHMIGAHIGGQLNFVEATLTNPGGLALNLDAAQIGALLLRPTTAVGRVNLTHVKASVLADDQATWPRELHMVGFVYDALAEGQAISAKQRLDWLRRDPDGYNPQPYEHLVAVYRRAGREEDARRVAIAKQRQRRRELSWPARLWSLLLGALVGHGYRTWFAAGWLVLLLAIGTLVYQQAYPAHMRPAEPGKPVPTFQAVVYALDVLLPVVDLGQQADWIPQGVARWWTWVSILAGWVLTTAVVAALTGLLKRE